VPFAGRPQHLAHLRAPLRAFIGQLVLALTLVPQELRSTLTLRAH
jgi:hypothetical protein